VKRVALTLVVTGLCTAYILWKIDLGKTGHVLATARIGWWLLSLGIMVASVFPMAWRWQRLLAARGVHDSLTRLVRTYFVGALRAGDEGIRLTGRDPSSGIDVALSIPLSEVECVRVSASGDELLAGEPCVVLELADSEPIFIRQVGVGACQVHVLARRLGALTEAPSLLAQGG